MRSAKRCESLSRYQASNELPISSYRSRDSHDAHEVDSRQWLDANLAPPGARAGPCGDRDVPGVGPPRRWPGSRYHREPRWASTARNLTEYGGTDPTGGRSRGGEY